VANGGAAFAEAERAGTAAAGATGSGPASRRPADAGTPAAQPTAPAPRPVPETPTQHVERLRAELVRALGEERFYAAHDRLLQVVEEEDDELLARDVNRILGDGHMEALGEILHLIDCEEQLADLLPP